MKRVSLLVALAAVALWSARPAADTTASPAAQGRVIEIVGTDAGGKYIFKPDVINAKPGEQLLVRLKSVAGTMGKMPKMAMAHNFVLIKPGNDPLQFANAGVAGGFQASYIAPNQKDLVIAFTPLAGVDETVEVSFKAPAAGTYPFLCSFPGHVAGGMKGTMVVK
jgi:azurin